nr:hypothetical protein [uncultured Butyricicoccus sp.]
MERLLCTSVAGTDEKLNRWFTILKIVLFCMPFLYLGYVGIGTGGASLADEGVLQANPTMAVSFLSAMIQPYAAWILILSQRRLQDGRSAYAMVNLGVLLVAQLMMMSTVGVVGFALILWRCTKHTGFGPLAALRQTQPRRLFAEAGGSVVVLLLAAVCLFATVRIGALPV